jgi:hypothetical protein
MAQSADDSGFVRRSLRILPWAISLSLHGIFVAALAWNVQPAPRIVQLSTVHEIRAEFLQGAAFRTPFFTVEPIQSRSMIALASYSAVNTAPALLPAEQTRPVDSQTLSSIAPQEIESAGDSATVLFGVEGNGTRFVYVFDRSASMAAQQSRPLAAAKRELIASLQDLQSTQQFQIIFYNETLELMPRPHRAATQLVLADERGKRQAEQFIGGIYAHGGTRHLAALQTALALRPDVIFLLTDASPPELSPIELSQIRQLNHKTCINTIEFGVGPLSGQYNFLIQLAEENRGQHAYVDVTRLVR